MILLVLSCVFELAIKHVYTKIAKHQISKKEISDIMTAWEIFVMCLWGGASRVVPHPRPLTGGGGSQSRTFKVSDIYD